MSTSCFIMLTVAFGSDNEIFKIGLIYIDVLFSGISMKENGGGVGGGGVEILRVILGDQFYLFRWVL